jgi:hypothetical protein
MEIERGLPSQSVWLQVAIFWSVFPLRTVHVASEVCYTPLYSIFLAPIQPISEMAALELVS